MKKSIQRLEEERLLSEYGLLEGKQIYNPLTNRDIQATRANITRIYNILLEEIRQQEIRQERANITRIYNILLEELQQRSLRQERANITRNYNILLEELVQRAPIKVDFKELIQGDRKYVLELNLNGGLRETFMLNSSTVKQINKLINQRFREEKQNEYGSDAIYRANIIGILN